ncbi:hypothetical protein CIB95_02000 [Lottiidibacillus patelloidae]|uniref:Bacterial transcriptional activator domain-containing protein n=1 Tax=Lottiidibacillus patelloidae TaxID=2670334 RepID=A0A263BYX1_9BACI|nr:BTAD domain-containing putative transcriptional regulator [Lottiidibacillus patelloidae]OZM58366.1 hypothetical protein CIB95_02000 [Lottiidibacillus patelloidae]
MMIGYPSVIKTKFISPLVKENIVQRPMLMKKLSTITNYPITYIHAGPGYGKSTAAALYVNNTKYQSCWYSISKNDDDILPFLLHLIYALKKIDANFGNHLLSEWKQERDFVREDDILSYCTDIINELAEWSERTLIVLDDFHLISENTMVMKWFTWLIKYLPEHIHFIITSRTNLESAELTTLKVKGSVLEISEKDLTFTPEEIEVLFVDTYGIKFSPDEFKLIREKTEGWIIALQMLCQHQLGKESYEELSKPNVNTLKDLFQFLAMEVFSKQSTNVQHFLLKTSVLEAFSAKRYNELYFQDDGSEMIEYLLCNHLFILKQGEEEFRYHALFKEFLQQELMKEPSKYENYHRQAAQFFIEHDMYNHAIDHFRLLKDIKSISKLLVTYGQQMLENGQLTSLSNTLKTIPKKWKDKYYRLYLYEGDMMRYHCFYEEAKSIYMLVSELAGKSDDKIVQSMAHEGVAKIYLDTIQPTKADAVLLKAIQILELLPETEKHLFRLYRLMAENLINMGNAKKAERWYNKSLEINDATDEVFLEARLKLRTGRIDEAKQLLEKKIEMEIKQEKVQLPKTHRETMILLSLIKTFMGEVEEAKKLGEQGILQGIKQNSPFVEACGWMRMGHAVQLIPNYDLNLAISCYHNALKLMEEIGIPRGKAEPLMGLSLIYARKNDPNKSLHYGNQALNETALKNDLWLSSYLTYSIGIAHFELKNYEKSEQAIQNGFDTLTQCQDRYGQAVGLMWLSIIKFYLKEWEAFDSYFNRFLQIVESDRFDFLLKKRTMFGPIDVQLFTPLLLKEKELNPENLFVSRLLHDLGIDNQTSHPGYTLRIETFDNFRVYRGAELIAEKDWQRGKAKELLQLFINNRNRFLEKEEIYSTLWKDLDEETSSSHLKVALNALNKTLEPTRKARSTPIYIRRKGSAYGLNLSASIDLDVAQFEHCITSGLEENDRIQAKEWLEKGLPFYKGEFLRERRYDAWCNEERERLQTLFLRGSEKLAQIYVEKNNINQAIHLCERIITVDNCWEEAYRLLMYCYYRKNNRSLAIKYYKKCCEVLENDLSVKPMEATEQMYEMIVST